MPAARRKKRRGNRKYIVLGIGAAAALIAVPLILRATAKSYTYTVTQDASGNVSVNGSQVGMDLAGALNAIPSGANVLVKSSPIVYSSTGIILNSPLEMDMEPSVVINDLSTAKLPGNSLFGAAIRNQNFGLAYGLDSRISIQGGVIRPAAGNVGVAFGGVNNPSISCGFDLSLGYRAVDLEACASPTMNGNRVFSSSPRAGWCYGLGSGLSGFSAPVVGNTGLQAFDNDISGVTGDSFIFNSGDQGEAAFNYIAPQPNASTGFFDAFVDMQGKPGYPSAMWIHDTTMVGPPNGTAPNNGIMVGGNIGQVKVGPNIVVDATQMSLGSNVDGAVSTGGNSPQGTLEVSGNRFLGVNIVLQFGQPAGGDLTPQLTSLKMLNNFWTPTTPGSAFVNPAVSGMDLTGVHLDIEGNDLSHGGIPWNFVSPIPANAIIKNNLGWALTQG